MDDVAGGLTEALDWLTKYNAPLTLLFSCVVAIATVVYAMLTRALVRETMQLRKVETDPEITVFLQPYEGEVNLLTLVVRNIGKGPAYAVNFGVEQHSPVRKEVADELAEIALFKGVPYIAPSQQYRFFFGSAITLLNEPVPGPIVIATAYTSKQGERLRGSFTLNIEEFKGVTRLGASPLFDIARETKSIARELGRVSRELGQLGYGTRIVPGASARAKPLPPGSPAAEPGQAEGWLHRWWRAVRLRMSR